MKRTTGTIIGLLAIMIMPLLYMPVAHADFVCGPDDSPEYCQQQADEAVAATEAAKAAATAAAEKAATIRNASGQGFKLPLDFLTLTTVDSSGKKVKQGSSIFANKDYATYGVLLGTFLRIIDILVYVIGSVALLTLIVAGIMMIANHGDEGWVTKGKGMMLYSILGVIFALLSFIFVNIITSLLS